MSQLDLFAEPARPSGRAAGPTESEILAQIAKDMAMFRSLNSWRDVDHFPPLRNEASRFYGKLPEEKAAPLLAEFTAEMKRLEDATWAIMDAEGFI